MHNIDRCIIYNNPHRILLFCCIIFMTYGMIIYIYIIYYLLWTMMAPYPVLHKNIIYEVYEIMYKKTELSHDIRKEGI